MPDRFVVVVAGAGHSYRTGATRHPAGSIYGEPGRNAASVMLKDLGSSIENVVAKNAIMPVGAN